MSRPLRIVHINDIASVGPELARGLRALGHDVDVVRLKLVGGKLPWAVKPIVGPARGLEWTQVIRRVRAGHYDIVHIHYAYLGMLGVLGRFPYVLHCHGTDVREMTPFTRPMVLRSLSGAEFVWYSTPDLDRCVVPHRADAEFLPNPIDTETFAPAGPASASEDVLIICALDEIKGANRLLAACRQLARHRPEIRITAISGGSYTAEFAKLPNVTLVPHRPRPELPALANAHGIAVGQMRLGILSMAELEAMSCGRPMVIWHRYPRAYSEPPPVLRAVDGVDIAAAITRLVDDAREREAIGEAGRAWVQREHALPAAAARVEQVYREVLARR